ncbi:hypothetical protein RO21_01410 [[Actinobacillus] muris]|uniref:DUF2251 domain-containing protein n=1 Tax=Muribacter muris TaxID=67855 RepID=A0A0J5P9T7_9PAST|nr:DUF2251 domain-containing protein [Muribacter muris]KMK52274.1 hypothetical protein RO21_01410 [[Actinobacillus] muris] [Muribacter muris]
MLYSVIDDHLHIGSPYRTGAHSTQHEHLVVMFEDDGETGFFYAMDLHQTAQPVVDSLFVYRVSDIEQHTLKEPRRLQICWSEDGYTAFLMINEYPHAVFDFRAFIGYNRTKLPDIELGSMWQHKETTPSLVEQWFRG